MRMSKKHHTGDKEQSVLKPPFGDNVNLTENVEASLKIEDEHALESEAVLSGYELKISEESSGPIPSPRFMAGYAKLDPTFPERIMSMAEKQLDHKIAMDCKNMELQEKAINDGFSSAKRGQWLGFFIAIIILAVSVTLAFFGYETLAGILIGTAFVAIVGLFVQNAKNQKK